MRLEAQNTNASNENGLPTANGSLASTIIKNNINNNIIPTNGCPIINGSSVGNHLHHGPVKMPVKITNITTSHQLNDTLHQRSKVKILFLRKETCNKIV